VYFLPGLGIVYSDLFDQCFAVAFDYWNSKDIDFVRSKDFAAVAVALFLKIFAGFKVDRFVLRKLHEIFDTGQVMQVNEQIHDCATNKEI
jgi:hypothetical protein